MRRRILTWMAVLLLAPAVAGCARDKAPAGQQLMNIFSPDAQTFSSNWKSRVRELVEGTTAEEPTGRSLLAMARLSERRDRSEQADQLYRVVIEREPENPIPHHRLGVMAAKQKDFVRSEEHFRKAYEFCPTSAELISDMGYSYYIQNRLPEAEAILRRGLEVADEDPAICNNLAIVLAEQGQFDESLAMFRQTNTEAEALANLAFMHTQRGEIEWARACYSHALTLDGSLRPAAEAMLQLASHATPSQVPYLQAYQVANAPVRETRVQGVQRCATETQPPAHGVAQETHAPLQALAVQAATYRQSGLSGGFPVPRAHLADIRMPPQQTYGPKPFEDLRYVVPEP